MLFHQGAQVGHVPSQTRSVQSTSDRSDGARPNRSSIIIQRAMAQPMSCAAPFKYYPFQQFMHDKSPPSYAIKMSTSLPPLRDLTTSIGSCGGGSPLGAGGCGGIASSSVVINRPVVVSPPRSTSPPRLVGVDSQQNNPSPGQFSCFHHPV